MPSLPALTPESRARGRAIRQTRLAAWADLPLRQTFADSSHMRGFLSQAGIHVPSDREPATVKRLRQLLRRAGVTGDGFLGVLADGRALGLEGFLERNPALPLWAAVAWCLELAA